MKVSLIMEIMKKHANVVSIPISKTGQKNITGQKSTGSERIETGRLGSLWLQLVESGWVGSNRIGFRFV